MNPVHAVAHAKINLTLEVGAARSDGFHEIRSLFVPVSLADELWIEPAANDAGFALAVDGLDPGCETAENLVVRAHRLFETYTRRDVPARARLRKRIPTGAGLGGGSADAAATIRGLADATGLALTPIDLSEMAQRLGSDVPFFLGRGPARVSGRGEIVEILPAIPPLAFVLAKTAASVETRSAYRRLDEARASGGATAVRLRFGERTDRACAAAREGAHAVLLEEVAGGNDFESICLAANPELAAARTALLDAGCAPVALAGSGSAFFGVAPDPPAAEAAAARIRSQGMWAHAAVSCGAPIEIRRQP